MKKLTDYGKISRLTDLISVEKPYPLSILEGIQSGEIFVDDVDSPKVALIWHYCGFANILGDYNERFIGETVSMMRNPLDGHSGRLALQAENDLKLQEMILKTPGVSKYDRYIFEFRGEKNVTAPVTGLKPEEINADNYDLMRGWIVPTFSWETKNAFLEKGFEIIGTHPWYKYEG